MKINKVDLFKWGRIALAMAGFLAMCFFSVAHAAGGDASGIGGVANTVKGSFKAIGQLITAASYVAGMGFGVGSIMKFKAHKDNPQQIPVGTPIALLFIAAALLFMPSIFSVAGGTLFGASGSVGGVSGVTSF